MAMDIFRHTSFMKLDKIKFNKDKLNLCQVSLKGNIPIIIENYRKLTLFYKDFNIFNR